jgi:hypothetical protein
MMKIKTAIYITCTLLFFILVWLGQNINYLSFPTFETLLLMNNSAFGYSSMMAHSLFYTIPYLLVLNILFPIEKYFTLYRWYKRELMYQSIFVGIIYTALLYSFLHTFVNLLFTYTFLGSNLISKTNFILICVMSLINLFLFYLSVGLFYRVLVDKTQSFALSIFMCFTLMGVLFFAGKLYLPVALWNPLKDLVVYSKLIEDSWNTSQLVFVFFRQIGLVVFLYLISSWIFLRRDFLQ